MKRTLKHCLSTLAASLALTAHCQGTFIYDQQSSDESYIAGDTSIRGDQPGQSFTPALSAVDFIRLAMHDYTFGNSKGATVYVNLRANSIAGPVLATTSPVSMPDSFTGVANFFFPTSVPLTPGLTYYIQPILQAESDAWGTAQYNSYNYPGGMLFYGTTPSPNFDMWFREGQYIPEPSTAALALTGLAVSGIILRLRKPDFGRIKS